MQIGIPAERAAGERRVAMVPDVLWRLTDAGHRVLVEAGAGQLAYLTDDAYLARGAEVVSAEVIYGQAEVVCKVQAPSLGEISELRSGVGLVSFLQPSADIPLVEALADAGLSTFSLDLLPRTSRAQAMDALSSQATVSGYRAALLAAELLPKFFPLFMTAAGTVAPAKVLVLGAGVAGLQAIATARRLGAVVRGHDVRPNSREEVESLGAVFVEVQLESLEGEGGYARVASEEFLERQRELIATEVAAADAVITTAAVPGKRAPLLITSAMVEQMAPGSVIVDLAAESGGNCELSEAGENVVVNDVTICGVANLPSSMPLHASMLYARNIAEFVALLSDEGAYRPNFDDELVSGTCVTHNGTIVHEPTRELIS